MRQLFYNKVRQDFYYKIRQFYYEDATVITKCDVSYKLRQYTVGIVITCKNVSKRSRTLITVITQIRTFSLNLGTSSKNFETNKPSLERSF